MMDFTPTKPHSFPEDIDCKRFAIRQCLKALWHLFRNLMYGMFIQLAIHMLARASVMLWVSMPSAAKP